jgi:type IV secretory pathway VirB10-like protein
MTDRDPVRLFEATDVSSDVSATLRAARAYAPSQEQVEALVRSVTTGSPPGGSEGGEPASGQGEPPGAAPDGGAGPDAAGATNAVVKAAGSGSAWKIGAALVGAGALASGALYFAGDPQERSVAPAPPSVVATPAPPTTGSTAESMASPARTSPPPTAAPSASSPQPPTSPTGGRTAEPAAPASEMELLAQAQGALASDPAKALRHCAEHATRFPAGSFSQEREVIAIDALVRLGKKEEARARAERFRTAHPRSAYLRRIDVLVGPTAL